MRLTRLALVLLLPSLPALAQAPDSVRVLPAGTAIRLTLTNNTALTGRAVSSSDSALVIRTSAGVQTVRLSSIRQSELRRGSAGKVALISGLTGAFIGAGGAILFKDFGCQYEGCSNDAQPVAGAVVIGLPAAIIGAFAGTLIQHWRVEPRQIAISAPNSGTGPASSIIDGRDCSAPPSGHASVGMGLSGGVAAGASLVISCQPQRWFSLEAGYADLRDDRDRRTSNVRFSIVGERFVYQGIRALFSIDRNNGRSDNFPLGAGAGLVGARRLRGALALRSELRVHARDGAGLQWTGLFGLERIR